MRGRLLARAIMRYKATQPSSIMINLLRTFQRLAGVFGTLALAASSHADDKVVAYVPNWIDLTTFSGTIDFAKITHINIAFENPTNADGDLSFDKKNEVLIATANRVKVLVSIGGGFASSDKALVARYFDLLTDVKRGAFATKLAEYVSSHHFDGLDVDLR